MKRYRITTTASVVVLVDADEFVGKTVRQIREEETLCALEVIEAGFHSGDVTCTVEVEEVSD